MPALTPSFTFDFESEMQRITENEFLRMTQNLWYRDIAKVRQTGKKREILAWLLSTARIYDAGKTGGDMIFDDMAATYQEYDVVNDAAGLKLTRNQLEDNDGNGFDFAAEWSSQMGALMAYRPQEKITTLILNGTAATAKAYDTFPFFLDNSGTYNGGNGHPVNQFRTASGGYWNWFHGAASGSYPGALPIDPTNASTVDTALANLQKAIAYIASIKMPNGKTPRFLRPRRLIVPPALTARAQQLTNARYIAQPAGASGGGSGDIEAVLSNWGFTQPLEVQEFAKATLADGGNSDTTWYLACEQVQSTQLGALVYVEREPFRITYYTGQGGGTGMDAILDRARELEWHTQGRNVAGYGHPYALFRFDGT
jgi:phage major head subunit gpT-like protein